tara:strand:- start:166 stop:363 length:198 start_codon:yes stop_codon:yes gene_type:complete
MKVGDLVTLKMDAVSGGPDKCPLSLGIVVDVQNCPISVTYPVWVSWNFLQGDIKRQNSYQLKVIK